jgi:hypothetical protein
VIRFSFFIKIKLAVNGTDAIRNWISITISNISLFLMIFAGSVSAGTWARTYGGADNEIATSIQQTSDGGFVVAGTTNLLGGGRDDFWVLKLDALGDVEWQKIYDGGKDEFATSIQQTSDGGFSVAGYTSSFGGGWDDFWVLKLDALGDVEWQKTYGGPLHDQARSIQETSDGGFVVGGSTRSISDSLSEAWVLKLDALGDVEWQKAYGGNGLEGANSIQETSDGGFVVAGGLDYTIGDHGDIWVLKLDTLGNVEWQKSYGGYKRERPRSIQQTNDGGFVVGGQTWSFRDDSPAFWVLKLDSSGNIEWQRVYYSGDDDRFPFVQQTTDGGFAVAGWIGGWNRGVIWVLKLDFLGNIEWQKTYGGGSWDRAQIIEQTVDGGFVVAGQTYSFGSGNSDFWVLKLDANGEIDPSCTFISNTSVTADSLLVNVTDSTTSDFSTTTIPANTSVVGIPTSATVIEQCSGGEVEVLIDIKPGSFPNSINPRSNGVIPVAILTTPSFDATLVDPLSVQFGPAEATEAHGRGHIEDVDGDGDLDLVLHFRTQETGIQCGDTEASLTGETFDGYSFTGTDSIRTVGCREKELLAAVPNPFFTKTRIRYEIPKIEKEGNDSELLSEGDLEGNFFGKIVRLRIYDITGRLVKNLIEEEQDHGEYSVEWSGEDEIGERLTSGVYFYKLEIGSETRSGKLILLR